MSNIQKWQKILPKETIKSINEKLDTVEDMREINPCIYPAQDDILKALQTTAPEDIKVIILGQDPYHTGVANGLAFSVDKTVKQLPPSLQNIYKELNRSLNIPIPTTGDLTPWAEQGVFLLNTMLTVDGIKKAASHEMLDWQSVTKEILKTALVGPQPKVVMCWGSKAKDITDEIMELIPDTSHILVLNATHPSPFSANRASSTAPAFIGCNHFKLANEFLTKNNVTPINWNL